MRIEIIKIWNEIVNSRRNLALQSDYFLEDIGLNRSDVGKEFNRIYWQA